MSERLLNSAANPEMDRSEKLITGIEQHLGQSAVDDAFNRIAFEEIIDSIDNDDPVAVETGINKRWGGKDSLYDNADWK